MYTPPQDAKDKGDEEYKEPTILVELPPHVEQVVQEVTQESNWFGRLRAWWYVLREELRHEEQWRLPVLPRTSFIGFKWTRPPPDVDPEREAPSGCFILYRVALLAYWSGWVSVAVVGAQKGIHLPPPLYEYVGYGVLWLVFATNWSAIILWLYLALACVALVLSATPPTSLEAREAGDADTAAAIVRMERKSTDFVRTLAWVLRDTVAPAAVMVTLLYWLLLFPIYGYTNFVDVHLHLVNAIIILTDMWVSRLPYWLLHFPAPLAYLCVYILFSGFYYLAGGDGPSGNDYIYPWLDYDRPAVTVPIIFFVICIVFPIVHASLWAFERQSRKRAKRRFQAQDVAATEEAKAADLVEEQGTQAGETGRRRRQRRQRLVSPPPVALPHLAGTSRRPHSQRYRWPWAYRRGIRPLTQDELKAFREELLLEEEEGEDEVLHRAHEGDAEGGPRPQSEGSIHSAKAEEQEIL